MYTMDNVLMLLLWTVVSGELKLKIKQAQCCAAFLAFIISFLGERGGGGDAW